ncbi:MAG: FTR1 family iron permease [Planctomycetota bacterium]
MSGSHPNVAPAPAPLAASVGSSHQHAPRDGLQLPAVRPAIRWLFRGVLGAAAALVLGYLLWQGITAQGNPMPDQADATVEPATVVMQTGVLVFREGLEAILVLAALTTSLVRTQKGYWKPVAIGSSLSFIATIATWFIAVGLITQVDTPATELHVQAATGLLAVVVLLVIMNWFFHKLYWTGWISMHNKRKRSLTADDASRTGANIYRGLLLLGFTAVYREGFEVVLFLQTMRMRAGSAVVLEGVTIGVSLTILVGILIFVLHYKLPYKKMLVFTGLLLGAVLLVMVGESVQEMQQAGWFGTHSFIADENWPGWIGQWFATFPNWEGVGAQAFALVLVVGSYFMARRMQAGKPGASGMLPAVDGSGAGEAGHVPDAGLDPQAP